MEEAAANTWFAWMKRIQEFKAGALGVAVVAVTLLATAFFAFQPEIFFPSGRYPRVVMMLPALFIGAGVFLAASAATWLLQRRRKP
jgi:hypothetical protein